MLQAGKSFTTDPGGFAGCLYLSASRGYGFRLSSHRHGPVNGFVISHNRYGDFLFYLTKSDSLISEHVYLYDHETLEIFFVANSIKDILGKIYPEAECNKLLETV